MKSTIKQSLSVALLMLIGSVLIGCGSCPKQAQNSTDDEAKTRQLEIKMMTTRDSHHHPL